MKVRANSKYIYQPVMLDVCDPPYGAQTGELEPGDLVQVVNLNGCPRANTMGMCHINKDGRFAGLVCTNSLQKP